MESRMEKYYKEDLSNFERTRRYEDLYKDVTGELSKMDKLPIPDNANEIDIDGLKKIISSRDEYRRNKEFALTRSMPKVIEEERPLTRESIIKEDKVYDINVLLENAKNEITRSNIDDSKRLTHANFLTTMEEGNIPLSDDATDISEEVVNKNKSSNEDSLPLDILMDLKGSDDTIVTDPIIKDEVTMVKNIKDGETFYSGSFNFSKKDFDDDDFEEEEEHTGIKIFFLIFGFVVLAAAIYLVLINYIL